MLDEIKDLKKEIRVVRGAITMVLQEGKKDLSNIVEDLKQTLARQIPLQNIMQLPKTQHPDQKLLIVSSINEQIVEQMRLVQDKITRIDRYLDSLNKFDEEKLEEESE